MDPGQDPESSGVRQRKGGGAGGGAAGGGGGKEGPAPSPSPFSALPEEEKVHFEGDDASCQELVGKCYGDQLAVEARIAKIVPNLDSLCLGAFRIGQSLKEAPAAAPEAFKMKGGGAAAAAAAQAAGGGGGTPPLSRAAPYFELDKENSEMCTFRALLERDFRCKAKPQVVALPTESPDDERVLEYFKLDKFEDLQRLGNRATSKGLWKRVQVVGCFKASVEMKLLGKCKRFYEGLLSDLAVVEELWAAAKAKQESVDKLLASANEPLLKVLALGGRYTGKEPICPTWLPAVRNHGGNQVSESGKVVTVVAGNQSGNAICASLGDPVAPGIYTCTMNMPAVNHAMVGVIPAAQVGAFTGYSVPNPGLRSFYCFDGTHYPTAQACGLPQLPANTPLRIKLDTNFTPHRLFFAHGASAWVQTHADIPAGACYFAACPHSDTQSITLGTCPP